MQLSAQLSSQCDCFQNLAYKAQAESDPKVYYQNISPFKKSYEGRLVPYAITTQKYQVTKFSLLMRAVLSGPTYVGSVSDICEHCLYPSAPT